MMRLRKFIECPEMEMVGGNVIDEDEFFDCEMENDFVVREIDLDYGSPQEDSLDEHGFRKDLENVASGLEGLNRFERDFFINKMLKFEKLFTRKSTNACVEPYQFRVKPHRTVIRKTYPVPMAYRGMVRSALGEMLQAGIIERSNSAYCNPLRIVIKSDNSVRVCLDARYINEIIESDHESPPLINEIMQKFHGVTCMSTTDLTAGYWQIPLHENCRRYTAFLFDGKMYQFCRIPFVLKTAGSAFIRSLSLALGDQLSDILTIYVDDFLFTTRESMILHISDLCRVFEILQSKNFTLNLIKSKFCQTRINFLGYELSTEGISPLADKLDLITQFEKPNNIRELQTFIGLCTYYRVFTVRHANLIDPFRNLLREKNLWSWEVKHDIAFEQMKKAFMNCVRLSHYLPNAVVKLRTDASDLVISGVLYQIDQNNDHRIVSLVSRCLNQAELNYTTTEKELLAIVYSVVKFRIYLIGARFEIITDHKALTFLNTTPYLNARIIRWSIILQQYDFDVFHCKGKDNLVADFFSRNPQGRFESNVPTTLSIDVLDTDDLHNSRIVDCDVIEFEDDFLDSLRNLSHLQNEDSNIKNVLDKINENLYRDIYVVKENIWFRKDPGLNVWQVVIPNTLKYKLIDCIHSKLGHPGVYKTKMYIRQFYYWKSMNRDIKRFVVTCDLCQRVKDLNVKMEGPHRLVQFDKPSDLICVDFYGPLPRSVGGFEYIFVVLDAFSKYVKLYPIRKATTDTVLKRLFNDYIPEMGVPVRILADHGTQFTSSKWSRKLGQSGIRVVYSSIRHPQSNPAERVMRELGRLFRILCSDKHTRWARHLSDIEWFLNVTTHFSTGFSPLELHFGTKPEDMVERIIDFPKGDDLSKDAKILLAREKINNNYAKRAKSQKRPSRVILKENDLVLLHIPKQSDALKKITRKFFHIFYGPYRIKKELGNNAYELCDVDDSDRRIGIHNRINLRKYNDPEESNN